MTRPSAVPQPPLCRRLRRDALRRLQRPRLRLLVRLRLQLQHPLRHALRPLWLLLCSLWLPLRLLGLLLLVRFLCSLRLPLRLLRLLLLVRLLCSRRLPLRLHQEPQLLPLQPTKRIPTQPTTRPPSKLLRWSGDYMPPKRPKLEAIVEESCKQEAPDKEDEGHH